MPGPINFDFLVSTGGGSGGGGGTGEFAAVIPPSTTDQSVAAGGSPGAKTFGTFTDDDSQISSYQESITNVDGGSATVSGSGLGPYAFSSTADGETYILSLAAKDSSNATLATAIHVVTIATPVVDEQSDVTPPATTSEAVASAGTPAAKTFGSFTDPDATIASYSAAITNVIGSTAISGSGLGPYSFSGHADGDSFVVTLNALDSGGQVLATAVHVVSIATAAGVSSLDPDENINSLNSTNESNATTGWDAGTVTFRGPTESSQVTIGGTNASDFNISGGSNGVVQLNAAGNLSASGGPNSDGIYEITLTVNNEGGSGYTTPTIQIEVTPNAQSITTLTSSDGYVVYRRGNGAWSAYDFKSQGYNLRRIDGAQALEDNAACPTISILARQDSVSSNVDVFVGTDIGDGSTFDSGVDIGGTGASPTATHIDPINEYGMVSTNFAGGRIYYKTLADVVSDADFSGPTIVSLGWAGAGAESIQGMHTTSNGTNYAVGYSTSNPGTPHISRCPGAPSNTWTEQTLPGTITQGHMSGIESDGNLIVVVGGNSPNYASANDIHIVWSSDDGSNWNANVISSKYGLSDIAYNGTVWVGVGGGGMIFTSTDPTSGTWTERTSGTSNRLRAVCWDNDASEFVAAGDNRTVLSSADGTTWASETIAAGPGASAFFTGAESNLGEIV